MSACLPAGKEEWFVSSTESLLTLGSLKVQLRVQENMENQLVLLANASQNKSDGSTSQNIPVGPVVGPVEGLAVGSSLKTKSKT